jgi:polysaccharide biosynthesis transport protein
VAVSARVYRAIPRQVLVTNGVIMVTRQTNPLQGRDVSAKESGPGTLVDWGLAFASRQFRLLLSCLVIASSGAAAYLFFTPPAYTSTATMLIDSRKGGVQQRSVLGDAPTDSAWIDSQMGILTLERDRIAGAVAVQLQLAKDPHFLESGGGFGGLAGWFRGGIEDLKPSSKAELDQRVAGVVSSGLDVKRVGLSYLVNINFSSPNQEFALKIANAAADAYVVAEMDAKFKNLSEASNWLEGRYQTLRDQASSADRAVIEYKGKNNIVTAGGKLIYDQQLTEINDRLGAARAKTADSQARLNQIEAVLETNEATGEVDATVTDALNNPIINHLRSQYLDLINREADWSKRLGANHLAVVNLRNQAREIRNSTLEELRRIHEGYKSDLAIAQRNEIELKKQMAGTVAQMPNEAQIALRGLESSAQSYRAFTEHFLLNYTESVQQQSSPIPETRVVAYATYAYKSFPSTGRVFTLSLLGGMAFGVGLGMLREIMDRSFRTGRQTQAALQMECLALIPLVKENEQAGTSIKQKLLGANRRRDLITDPRSRRIISETSNIFRLVSDDPFSRFAEAIRGIKQAADVRGADSPKGIGKTSKVIGITSSVPREGKSTIAAALSGLIAEVGGKVILVDCDLRNPSLSRSLAPDAAVGLLEVVSGRQSLDKAIWNDPVTGMAFLPTVNSFGVPNTDQILGSEGMKILFEVLRSNYEYVVVDLSPLAPVVDVRATTNIIDFYVFVVEWGATKIDLAQQALLEAHRVYDSVLGVALNKVDMSVIKRYDSERSLYYSNKYYSGHDSAD